MKAHLHVTGYYSIKKKNWQGNLISWGFSLINWTSQIWMTSLKAFLASHIHENKTYCTCTINLDECTSKSFLRYRINKNRTYMVTSCTLTYDLMTKSQADPEVYLWYLIHKNRTDLWQTKIQCFQASFLKKHKKQESIKMHLLGVPVVSRYPLKLACRPVL